MEQSHAVTSVEQLEALYPAPSARALAKQIDNIDQHCAAFIAASPLVLMATCGGAGADCSPRGGPAGFVQIADPKTLLLPDHRGNNRLDTLRNLLENPKVGLLFLVAGVNETLRVNGTATISTDPQLRERSVRGQGSTLPLTVIVIEVVEAFIQCSKALVRSECWNPERHVERGALPSLGTILAAHTGGVVDAAAYDRESAAHVKATLY